MWVQRAGAEGAHSIYALLTSLCSAGWVFVDVVEFIDAVDKVSSAPGYVDGIKNFLF